MAIGVLGQAALGTMAEEPATAGAGSGYREFRGKDEFPSNMLHGILAIAMWIGSVHFDFFLLLFSFLFLPFSKFLMALGFLLIFMVLPIDPYSKFGLKLSRYICKHLCSYFPITLYVEDFNAFNPDRAYGLFPSFTYYYGPFPLLN